MAGDKRFAEEATRLAIESAEKGWGGPFGAVIVKDGEIIGRGQNRVLLTGIPVFHAEVTAIIDASIRLNPKALLGSDYYQGTILEMIPRPPGSPDPVPERAKMLQDAFMATMKDPEFLADAKKQKLDVEPRDGTHIANVIRKVYATPKSIIEKVSALTK